MRKKRILFCSEATFLNTGYATYTREILNYLHSTGKYEIAELGAYAHSEDPRAKQVPWKFFGAMPHPSSPKEVLDKFNSSMTYQFGEMAFDEVCLMFMPDIVCDIRDFWMLEFQERSPYRDFFKWCIMPTVDAAPQARQWVSTYQSADACLTYSDWAGEVLKKQSGNQIKYLGCSPPSAHPAYQIMENKQELKAKYNVPSNSKIIGTVMRNQRRKLFPDLFETFRKILDNVKDPQNYYLYCHTSYPDMGWDIPELLNQNGLASHVFMTYVCPETKMPFASLFQGAITESPFTGKYNASVASVKNGLSYEQLAEVINMFDVYVQYANSEGFGLPQVEAAACGVPVFGTDYSAMESILRQLKGVPIKPKALYKELETGCMRAVPDNDLAAKLLLDFLQQPESIRKRVGFETRNAFIENFQWDKSGKKWEEYFDSVEIVPEEQTWMSPPRYRRPEKILEDTNKPHTELARWLISKVLCDESKLNSFTEARLVRDLLYNTTTASTGGMYFNESSAAFEGKNQRLDFNFSKAYEHFLSLCNRHNGWESKRAEKYKL